MSRSEPVPGSRVILFMMTVRIQRAIAVVHNHIHIPYPLPPADENALILSKERDHRDDQRIVTGGDSYFHFSN